MFASPACSVSSSRNICLLVGQKYCGIYHISYTSIQQQQQVDHGWLLFERATHVVVEVADDDLHHHTYCTIIKKIGRFSNYLHRAHCSTSTVVLLLWNSQSAERPMKDTYSPIQYEARRGFL